MPDSGSRRQVARLTLYYREGCGLCEQMLAELSVLQSRYTFALERIDIDEDPRLVARFNALVPVLAVDGEILCCHYLDTSALIDELTRHD
ncbi:glutaredoxin family protein [Thioalkalivibrio paradoxus]|uniref:glutaredoxin family protein n=1 Tax=Thioalkalivibrio paradoxus TaxID=108010 RepID=UPI00022C2125|nr:glutaredoxin family protein [Thioalkalivibrio paradoxus]